MTRPAAILIFLLSATVAAISHAAPTSARQEMLLHILKHDCGSCHGITLKGGLGPPLTPDALDGKPMEYLTHIITNGQPDQAMPPWGELLAPEDIQWLAEQIKAGIAQ